MYYKHGMEGTKTYASWVSMKDRCNRPANNRFQYYGGRGISYDPRWEKFENFYADMGLRPQGATLDRLDSGADYCKANCRWATPREQARGRRNTIWIEYKGTLRSLADWARHCGVSHATILGRYRRYRDQPERIFAGLCVD